MQEALGLKGGGWTSFNLGVGVAPAPFEWGPHQSHPFLDSRIHPVIQQLILTEQAHSSAPGWAPATLVRPLMASASLGWGAGGLLLPRVPCWPPGAGAARFCSVEKAGRGGVRGAGLLCLAVVGWPPLNPKPGEGAPEPALLQGSAAGPSQPAPPAPNPPRLSRS